MVLKEIRKNELLHVADFAWKLSQNSETTSYPIYKDKRKFEEKLKESISKNNYKLLGYYENDNLIGIVNFFFIREEKYLQTTGVYIISNYEKVMDTFIDMLRNEYSCYRALFGFTKENINANNYFIENGYKYVDSCLDMRLNTTDFRKIKHNDKIFILKKEEFHEYADFHDKHFSRSYWTSNRLGKVLDNWYILIYKPEDNIEGSMFITLCNENTAEIFGISVSDLYKEKEIEKALLSEGLDMLFKDKALINETIFFIEDTENELNMVEDIGFNYYSSYRCYEVLL